MAIFVELRAVSAQGAAVQGQCFVENRLLLTAEPIHRSAWRGALALLGEEGMPELSDIAAIFSLARDLFDGNLIRPKASEFPAKGDNTDPKSESEDKVIAAWPPVPDMGELQKRLGNVGLGQAAAGNCHCSGHHEEPSVFRVGCRQGSTRGPVDRRRPPAKPAAAKVLLSLARDSKWEVRKAVADQLLHMPEALYDQLIPLLANDSNTFVLDSVKREMSRRSIQSADEKRRQSRPLKRAAEEIEARFGPDALRSAMKLAERRTEQVIRTAVHDIKGVLTPIKPSLDGLREAALDRTSRRRIERVTGGIEYLEQMLADMRQWSDEIELTLTEEDLAQIVESAAQDASDQSLDL